VTARPLRHALHHLRHLGHPALRALRPLLLGLQPLLPALRPLLPALQPLLLALAALTWLAAAGAARAQTASDEEVPFITTPDRVTLAMLQLAGVGPADVLVDLGSGDGRIVITAARHFGARGLGVDIVPDLVASSQASARRAGVADRASFRVQDLFDTDLAGASVITLYLLPEVNLRLRPRLLALAPGTRIVSHDWDMADWPPDRTLTLAVPEKAVGREKLSRVHLWRVPARLQGLWCGPGGVALQLQQRFQAVQGTLQQGAVQQALAGRIDGAWLQLLGSGDGGGSGGGSGFNPAKWGTEWAAEWVADQAAKPAAEAGPGTTPGAKPGATPNATPNAAPSGTLHIRQAPPGGPLQAGQQLRPAGGASCPPGG